MAEQNTPDNDGSRPENLANATRKPSFQRTLLLVAATSIASCVILGVGFWLGNRGGQPSALPPIMASTAASADTMAVATGRISEDTSGIFFLDFITGDLQCLVYYPRSRGFGARYVGNVLPHLGGGGNSKYLLVTGESYTSVASGNTRPGASLVYVTDVTTGMFAAFAGPWNRTAESAGRAQSGLLEYVGGGPIRGFQMQNQGQNQPAAVVDPNKK
jgi:hypothetical protein